ncbi:TetR/AcrR family transcriptional regulator [Nitrosophilus kaiyonis]|uniref:TetR/AcrR family transcriptional regulator n=1 Tax=Nitrosophilus kaiyonis TaxID=2930200 RepID=UPI0024902E4C|nr:TetR/AcrR family transcriptional regulator [Nitrosophilus kaiyonis]
MKEILKQKIEETKKELILQKVSDIFEKEGFSHLKMQDIAKKLGISIGALYKLFSSKEELFLAYVGYQIEMFYKKILKICENSENKKDCLLKYIQLKFEIFSEKRKALEDPLMGDPLFFLKMGKSQYKLLEPLHLLLAKWFEELDKIKPLKEKNFLKLSYLFHSFTNGYVEYWIMHGGDLEEDVNRAVDIFLKGVEK